ncbi:Uncharacterised protein [Mycobacteroides abscessus subsp. abscessus]|nr:Uncharacterised protein [Mycobacteroides abscessus subsp. abscessus]
MSGGRERNESARRRHMREWGPPVSLVLLVIGGASVGLLFGPDAAYWWLPLFVTFVFLPVAALFTFVLILVVELMWGNDELLQMVTRMTGRRKPKISESVEYRGPRLPLEWESNPRRSSLVEHVKSARGQGGHYIVAYYSLGSPGWQAYFIHDGECDANIYRAYWGNSESEAIAAAETHHAARVYGSGLRSDPPATEPTERRGGFWDNFRRLILSEGA